MSATTTTVRPEDTAGPINRIMLKYQLDKNDIGPKNPLRSQTVHGFGEFQCSICPNGYLWRSNFSWMRINLYDQMVEYKWSMKCKNCLTIEKPTFSTEETEKLIEKAVCQYKGIQYRPPEGTIKSKRYGPRKDPHLNYLCEKCGYGQTQCWYYFVKHY